MHRLRHRISSLSALLAFEAAARRESFTRAAEELGVTQAAVSRRIKALEAEVGCALFRRANRRVIPTEEGRTLWAAVARSFDGIADAIDEIEAAPNELTVAVSVAFAHFRLLPVLSSFRGTAPGLDLRVVSADAGIAPGEPGIDVAIRYGTPPFRGMTVAGSLDEAIVPVCAPGLADGLEGLDAAALARGDAGALIEHDPAERGWMRWPAWLARQGIRGRAAAPRLRFTSYSDAAYAAIDGQGIALGWTSLLERPLADGRLVPLDFPPVRPEERHWILVADRDGVPENTARFVEWLEETLGGAG
jgi:DNA-binding transcriptional LysR family regulator